MWIMKFRCAKQLNIIHFICVCFVSFWSVEENKLWKRGLFFPFYNDLLVFYHSWKLLRMLRITPRIEANSGKLLRLLRVVSRREPNSWKLLRMLRIALKREPKFIIFKIVIFIPYCLKLFSILLYTTTSLLRWLGY